MEVYVRCPKGHRQQYKDVEIDMQSGVIVYACPYCKQLYKIDIGGNKHGTGLLYQMQEESGSERGAPDVLQQRDSSGEGNVRRVQEQSNKDANKGGETVPKGEAESK